MNNPRLTCDWCRSKKIRCIETQPSGSRTTREGVVTCRACDKRDAECTFDFSHKRPGRPAGNRRVVRRSDALPTPLPSASPQRTTEHIPTSPLSSITPHSSLQLVHEESGTLDPPGATPLIQSPDTESFIHGPASWSLWGSAKSVFLPNNTWNAMLPTHVVAIPDVDPLGVLDIDSISDDLFLPSHHLLDDPSTSPQAGTGAKEETIESIAPWSTICFFLSLHVRHQYALVPLVHKPSFSQDLLHRRDLSDETFKAFLCSIVTHTVCQTPIRLVQHEFSLQYLHDILAKCRKTSRAIQIKYQCRLNYEIAASTVLDLITSQSTSSTLSTDIMASEVRRVIYTLGYHLPEPRPGMTVIETQLSRRLFWEAYCVDKTSALNGSPILFHDLEGTPPYPMVVLDEFITRMGIVEPPAAKETLATDGCLAVLELFRILYSVTIRHRAHKNCPEKLVYTSHDSQLQWTEASLARISAILKELPDALKISADSSVSTQDAGDAAHAIGIQQANIHVTALVTRLALINFKGDLTQNLAKTEMETVARESFELLSSIPIEALAANGESMRGKVLRVILALQNTNTDPADLGGASWDWWNMYSRVRFLQVIPSD